MTLGTDYRSPGVPFVPLMKTLTPVLQKHLKRTVADAHDFPGGKKGAGILRAKHNVHWRKGCGREPFHEQERFPWFWRNGEFTGERVNDVHLSTTGRQEVRRRVEARQ